MSASAPKNAGGSGRKPSRSATGSTGSRAPTATAPSAARVNGMLGWLRTNGTRLVRIAKMIRVCVARDSTNQPVRNSGAPAWNTRSMTANVRKSNTELTGPKTSMNRRMNPMSQCDGRCSCSGSTVSVGIASWLVS